jgi:hypothetical protein
VGFLESTPWPASLLAERRERSPFAGLKSLELAKGSGFSALRTFALICGVVSLLDSSTPYHQHYCLSKKFQEKNFEIATSAVQSLQELWGQSQKRGLMEIGHPASLVGM